MDYYCGHNLHKGDPGGNICVDLNKFSSRCGSQVINCQY